MFIYFNKLIAQNWSVTFFTLFQLLPVLSFSHSFNRATSQLAVQPSSYFSQQTNQRTNSAAYALGQTVVRARACACLYMWLICCHVKKVVKPIDWGRREPAASDLQTRVYANVKRARSVFQNIWQLTNCDRTSIPPVQPGACAIDGTRERTPPQQPTLLCSRLADRCSRFQKRPDCSHTLHRSVLGCRSCQQSLSPCSLPVWYLVSLLSFK